MSKKTPKPKRGRPPGESAPVPLNTYFRCPLEIKAAVESAAKSEGESVTQFWLTSAQERIARLSVLSR